MANTDPDRHRDDLVGVVGAGTMGAGIAQVAALAGHPVLVHDVSAEAALAAVRTASDGIRRLAKRELVDPERADAALARLAAAPALDDLADCVAVVEAVVEDLAAKRALFADLERVVGAGHPARVQHLVPVGDRAGRRDARPRAVRRPALLQPGEPDAPGRGGPRRAQSGRAFVELATNLVRCWGKTPVACASTPGFIVNRVARPFYGEAQRLVEDAAADPATIDALLREAGGFPLGPFELTDLIGQDVNLAVGALGVGADVPRPAVRADRVAAAAGRRRVARAARPGAGVYALRRVPRPRQRTARASTR